MEKIPPKAQLSKILLEVEIINRLIECPENDFEKENNIIKKADLSQKATLIIEKINKKKMTLIFIIYSLLIMTFIGACYTILNIIEANILIKGFTLGTFLNILFNKYTKNIILEKEFSLQRINAIVWRSKKEQK